MSLISLNYRHKCFLFNPDKQGDILRVGGKFSSVYKGIVEPGGSTVVIKKFNPVQKNAGHILERFKREAAININHPNIADSICFIEQDGHHYLVREYVAGEDVLSYLQRSKLKGKEKIQFILKCAIEVLDALDAVHQNKIIHCDIRPHNILLEYISSSKEINNQHPKIKLIDFGLAHYQEYSVTGKIPFSLIYSSPEQLLSVTDAINATSDLYSLAISLYELITGEQPFHYDHPELLMHIQLTQNLKPHKAIPDFIFQILLKASYKHQFKLPPNRYKKEQLSQLIKTAQAERFQSAKELKVAIIEAVLSL